MGDWSDWIGREERRRDRVTDSLLARWQATVAVLRRRPESRATDGSAGGSGLRPTPEYGAPPGLHWCLCTFDAPIGALGVDGHPAKGGFMPPIDLPRRMWAASEMRFLAPIAVGADVERVSTIASIEEKSGKSGRLVFVEVDHDWTADGVAAITERQTIVYRDAATQVLPLPATGSADLSGWDEARTTHPDPILLFRYSALTFNGHRIHYDLPYARDVEGYPGLVVQGPLMASLLMALATETIGPLAAFAFRGVSPAFAGQPLHLCARADGEGLALAAIGGDGRTVMTVQAVPAA